MSEVCSPDEPREPAPHDLNREMDMLLADLMANLPPAEPLITERRAREIFTEELSALLRAAGLRLNRSAPRSVLRTVTSPIRGFVQRRRLAHQRRAAMRVLRALGFPAFRLEDLLQRVSSASPPDQNGHASRGSS